MVKARRGLSMALLAAQDAHAATTASARHVPMVPARASIALSGEQGPRHRVLPQQPNVRVKRLIRRMAALKSVLGDHGEQL